MLAAIRHWYVRRIYRPGRIVSRFIAPDVKREIKVISIDDLNSGYIVGQVRTNNLLYVQRGMVAEQPFGEPAILNIDQMWNWSGELWGGLPDGRSIAE